jgi:hypothetical protein
VITIPRERGDHSPRWAAETEKIIIIIIIIIIIVWDEPSFKMELKSFQMTWKNRIFLKRNVNGKEMLFLTLKDI